MNPIPSSVFIDANLSEPKFGHAWKDRDGNVFAAVRMGAASLTFGSAADARAVARACAEAADAHEKLAADSDPAT